VSFRDKEAMVTFDPARVGVEQLAVKGAGFRAFVKGGDSEDDRGELLSSSPADRRGL
jgi:hypothetical protein